MTTVEVLRAAKARIDTPEKWMKNDFGSGRRLCMRGALKCAGGDYPSEAYYAMERAVPDAEPVRATLAGGKFSRTVRFNDAVGTTHAEVMAAFDRAIAIEEAKAQEFNVREPVTA